MREQMLYALVGTFDALDGRVKGPNRQEREGAFWDLMDRGRGLYGPEFVAEARRRFRERPWMEREAA